MPSPRPLVIAHRGARRAAPDNTLPAFRIAREMGSDWVELDVRRSADDIAVVFHDPVLADGRVIADVELMDLPPFVPTLAQVLVESAGMGVNIEIKNQSDEAGFDPSHRVAELVAEELAANVSALNALSGVMISSFNSDTLRRLYSIAPDHEQAFLFTDIELDELFAGDEVEFLRAVHPADDWVTPDRVRAAHEHGLLVNVWTVNDPERIVELAEMGVDGICTDVPDLALDVLSSWSTRR